MNLFPTCIKRLALLLLVLAFTSGHRVDAQLQVTSGGDPTTLVQNMLLGVGIQAFNVSTTGLPVMWGSFTTGNNPTNLGVTSGLILASGDVADAIGPNSSGSSGQLLQQPGDSLLDLLIPGYETHDAAVLEFDFIPQGDTMKFRYVFGSDEYPEWVGSSFNDVFGFFVSGTDPITFLPFTNKNVAIIPGTASVPVSINNVNGSSYSQYYVNNLGGTTIEYDGFTTVLTAWCHVVPCTQYHIKIAIADAGDEAYDSGVFLEAGSFTSGGIQTNISYSNTGVSTTTALEGCVDAILTFKLAQPSQGGFMIPYSILDNSTATYGIDYDSIPSPLLIPDGGDSVSIIIHPFLDGITEGTETVGLIVPTTICMTNFDTVYFTINDYQPLQISINIPDTLIPCGDTLDLMVSDTGGLGPYTYWWNTGDTTITTQVHPNQPTQYFAFITDACNYTAADSILVSIFGPFADAGADTAICLGGQATLSASGGNSYLWSTGAGSSSITVSPTLTTSYIVTVEDVCFDMDTVIVFVNPLPPVTASSTFDSICPGFTTQLTASGAATYTWTSIPPDPSLAGQTNSPNPVVSPSTGTVYTVTGTDTNTCVLPASTTVYIKTIPTSDFSILDNRICEGDPTQISYTGSASGSSIFLWDFDGGFTTGSGPGPWSIYWNTAGTYTISLYVIADGCQSPLSSDTISVLPLPQAEFAAIPSEGCPPLAVHFTNLSQNTFANTAYEWTFGTGQGSILSDPDYTYVRSGIYSVNLIVSNLYGCSDTLIKTAFINVFPVPEASFSIDPGMVTIFDPTITVYDRSWGNPASWIWDFGDGGVGNIPSLPHTYADTGTYTIWLTIANSFGCIDSTSREIRVNPDHTIYFPNAFSPNGDLTNDVYFAYSTYVTDFSMRIFSRWGEEVFHTEDILEGWDGQYKGKTVPPGVYTLIAYYRDALGAPKSYFGEIVVIR